MANLRDFITSISNSIKKKKNDDTGFFQQGKFTTQPVQQAVQNWQAKPSNQIFSRIAAPVSKFVNTQTILANPTYNNGNNYWGTGRGAQRAQNLINQGVTSQKYKPITQAFKAAVNATPLSMKETAVPAANAVFGKNSKAADIVGYGVKGATSLTPMGGLGTTQLINKISPKTIRLTTPQTNRQKTAERVSRAVYGTALTAPLGGSNAAINIGNRALQGALLNTGINTVSNIAQGKKLTNNLGNSALQGVENSWQLAFTNIAADKIAPYLSKLPVVGKTLKGLTPESMETGSKLLKNATSMGNKEAATKIFAHNALKLFQRATLEAPIETTWFTSMNKMTGDEKRKFVDAWIQDLPGNLVGNLAFAGLQTGKQGLDLKKPQIDVAVNSLKKVATNMFGGSQYSQSGKVDLNAKIGGSKEIPISTPQDELKGIDNELISNLKSDIDYLSKNKAVDITNLDKRFGETEESLFNSGVLNYETKRKIKDIVDILQAEPRLKTQLDENTLKLLDVSGYGKFARDIPKQDFQLPEGVMGFAGQTKSQISPESKGIKIKPTQNLNEYLDMKRGVQNTNNQTFEKMSNQISQISPKIEGVETKSSTQNQPIFKINEGIKTGQSPKMPGQTKINTRPTQGQLPLSGLQASEIPKISTSPLIPESNVSSKDIITQFDTQKGKLNVNKLQLTPQEKAEIQALQTNKIPSVISNQSVVDQSRFTEGRKTVMTDEMQQSALARSLNTRQEVTRLKQEELKLKKQKASDAELIKIKEQIINQSDIATQNNTFAGRLLQSLQIEADAGVTPEQRIYAMLKVANVDPSKYIKDAIHVNFDNPKEVVQFYRKYVPASFKDVLTEIRYANMLSSPLTQIRNITTNFLQGGIVKPIEKTLTGQLDWVKSKLTGAERQYYASQGIDYTKAFYSSLPEAWTNFKDFVSGEKISINSKFEHIPTGLTGVTKAYTTPLRVLEGADQFFKTLVISGEKSALSDSRLKLSENEISDKAVRSADYTLFRQRFDPDGELGQGYLLRLFDKFNSFTNLARRLPFGKWIVPFIQTPTNILKQGMEYSPAGIFTLAGAKNKTEQLAKTIMGSTVFAAAYGIADSTNVTWAAPSVPKDKELFYAAGMQPYSIKIGDKWVSFSQLGPLAYPIAMAVALRTAEKNNPNQDENKLQNMIQNVGSAMPQLLVFFSDQSYVEQLGSLIDVLRSGQGQIKKAFTDEFSNTIGQLVPYRSFMGWLTRIVDPTYRKPETVGENLKAQVPGLSTSVPAYQDIYGQDSKRDFPIVNAVSPLKVSVEKPEAKRLFDSQEQYRIDQNQIKKAQEEYEKTGKISGSTTNKTEGTKTKGIPQFYIKDDGSVGKLDVDKVISLPESTNYEKAIKTDKTMDMIKTVMTSVPEGDDRNKLLKALGVDEPTAQYYQIADQNQDIRSAMVMDKLGTAQSSNDVVKILLDGMYEINGKSIVTSALLNDLVKQGVITKDLKDYVLSTYAKSTGQTTSGGSSARKKGYYESKFSELKKISLPKTKTSSVKIILPKLPKINLKYE